MASLQHAIIDENRLRVGRVGGAERTSLAESIAEEFRAQTAVIKAGFEAEMQQQRAAHKLDLAQQRVTLLKVHACGRGKNGCMQPGSFFFVFSFLEAVMVVAYCCLGTHKNTISNIVERFTRGSQKRLSRVGWVDYHLGLGDYKAAAVSYSGVSQQAYRHVFVNEIHHLCLSKSAFHECNKRQ